MRVARADLVLPLESAEHAFLEVLLSQFTLKRPRSGDGVELRVVFDGRTPATWNRRGREMVRRRIPRFQTQAALYRTKIDRILLDGRTGTFRHDDPDFPFRWASAGALPILNIGRREYYCLFFRDIFPIGWNIANGATDNSAELLNPLQSLDRELSEELVILDPLEERRFVLRPDGVAPFDHSRLAIFQRSWRHQYPDLDATRYRVTNLPLRWGYAPDRVTVQMGSRVCRLQNCFVNINAGDFGIELDRIARITLDEGVVLCDGEVNRQRVLNRPLGLFDVSRLQRALDAGDATFVPDRFYHGGTARPGSDLPGFLNRVLLRDMRRWRSPHDIDLFTRTSAEDRLRLCPVTESIIRRHMQLLAARPPASTTTERASSRSASSGSAPTPSDESERRARADRKGRGRS